MLEQISWTARVNQDPRVNQVRTISGGKNGEPGTVLTCAHHQNAGFSAKDHNAGKGGKQQEKRKTEYKMD